MKDPVDATVIKKIWRFIPCTWHWVAERLLKQSLKGCASCWIVIVKAQMLKMLVHAASHLSGAHGQYTSACITGAQQRLWAPNIMSLSMQCHWKNVSLLTFFHKAITSSESAGKCVHLTPKRSSHIVYAGVHSTWVVLQSATGLFFTFWGKSAQCDI